LLFVFLFFVLFFSAAGTGFIAGSATLTHFALVVVLLFSFFGAAGTGFTTSAASAAPP